MEFYQNHELINTICMEIIKRLVDNSEFDEYKPDYGKTSIITLMLASMVGQLELLPINEKL
jgi:hypothetical protein